MSYWTRSCSTLEIDCSNCGLRFTSNEDLWSPRYDSIMNNPKMCEDEVLLTGEYLRGEPMKVNCDGWYETTRELLNTLIRNVAAAGYKCPKCGDKTLIIKAGKDPSYFVSGN